RLPGVGRRLHGVTRGAEEGDADRAHRRVVLDHQYALTAAGRIDGPGIGIVDGLRRSVRSDRQVQAYLGAFAGAAVDLEVAAALAREAVDHAQAEAVAVFALPGGEERLHRPGQDEIGRAHV